MSCGGGGVVERSSSDGCPWQAGVAGSSKHAERGVPDNSTNGHGVWVGVRGHFSAAVGWAGGGEHL